MGEQMTFPATFDEFAEQYKIVDKKEVYTNGTALIPIFRVKQWLDRADAVEVVRCKDCKHWENGYKYCKRVGVDFFGNSRYGENSFCSCGERNE